MKRRPSAPEDGELDVSRSKQCRKTSLNNFSDAQRRTVMRGNVMQDRRTQALFVGIAMLVGSSRMAFAEDLEVYGDWSCPSGYSLISPTEAQESRADLCSLLGTWDIVRLGDGGSMDGPGYGCGIRTADTRHLGQSFCKAPTGFVDQVGDGVCTGGFKSVSYLTAIAYRPAVCSVLGTWDIARLGGGGSMDGPGYGCGIRSLDSRGLGNRVCAHYSFREVQGDVPCPSGFRYLTPDEARSRVSQLCGTLGTWDIIRLAGGGSMDGPGYGCGIRDFDTRGLGNSLCTR